MKATHLLAFVVCALLWKSAFAQVATCTVTDINASLLSWYSSWGRPDPKYFGVKVGEKVEVEFTERDKSAGIDMKSGLLNYVEGRSGVESNPDKHRGFYFLNHKDGSNLFFDRQKDTFRSDVNGPYKIIVKMSSEKDFDLEFNIFDDRAFTTVHATYNFKCQM